MIELTSDQEEEFKKDLKELDGLLREYTELSLAKQRVMLQLDLVLKNREQNVDR